MLPSLYAEYEPRPQTIGILGGGQLAKMLSQEVFKMGMQTAIIEHGEGSPAGMMTKMSWDTGWNDREALDAFIEASDIITLENEFIAPEILEYIASKRTVSHCRKQSHSCKTNSRKKKQCAMPELQLHHLRHVIP